MAKVVVTKNVSVRLDLSLEEAIVLRWILDRIGGLPDTTIRKYSESISVALASEGFDNCSNPDITEDIHDSIYFTDASLTVLQNAVEEY